MEVRKTAGAGHLLRAYDPLRSAEPDQGLRLRIAAQRLVAPRRRFERERVGRIGGHFTVPRSRDDLVLIDRRDRAVGAERHQRGKGDDFERIGAPGDQRVFDPAQRRKRSYRCSHEPVGRIALQQFVRKYARRATPRYVEQQRRQVGAGQVRERIDERRHAELLQHAIDRLLHVPVPAPYESDARRVSAVFIGLFWLR